ncbi:MAG: Dihydrofolate reductase [Candidatus Magasanikbacteria bacterium GW2011_GWC2_37_14]|uniref:Dihydrofolate reductase n=1 Tax=Candidatus Magasanikbacteria bacterium GW2011_GWC2_37_14 TaxID=1619046 RepID=A0A0G0G7H6_9BACT|nr:MAG: Dihydrofolate reductase [Candidatus Magasanikbacteria bacterium GW2011_GWC2_37_14]
MFSLIAAVAKNNCIGANNKIPWNIPEDFQYFKKTTLGKTCLMGKATFESIISYLGKPLPERKTAVITSDKNYQVPEGVRIFSSLDEAFADLAAEDVFVCGGASIYKQTIDRVDILYITEIDTEPAGDTFFPEINKNIWHETWREKHEGFSFIKYSKLSS